MKLFSKNVTPNPKKQLEKNITFYVQIVLPCYNIYLIQNKYQMDAQPPIYPPITIQQFRQFSYYCKEFGKASLQFASLLRHFTDNRNGFNEIDKKSKLEKITGYKDRLERVFKSSLQPLFVQYITSLSSKNFTEGKLKQLETSQILSAIQTVQNGLLCSDIQTALISQDKKTEGGDSFYEKRYGEKRMIGSGLNAICRYYDYSKRIMEQLNESFEFWKKTSEKHCTQTQKKVELSKAFSKIQEQNNKIQCYEMLHQPPPKLDQKQLKGQLQMSPFQTKRPENKIPQENDDMIKYAFALSGVKWLFEPMPLKTDLPKINRYQNMPVEKQYMHTFRDLFNSANELKKHLKSGDQVQVLNNIVDSRQGLKTLENLVAGSLFQIQTKISDVSRQFQSVNNELVISQEIKPAVYPILNIENEGACDSSLQNLNQFIPKEKEYLKAQELTLKWDSKKAILMGKKTLLEQINGRLKLMQKTYNFLSIDIENLAGYVELESMSEIEPKVPKYQSELREIQYLSKSEMKVEAEFTPDYKNILSAEILIAKCYEDKIHCILESCRYKLIALLRNKMADERHQKNLRQSYERDEAASAQRRRAEQERRRAEEERRRVEQQRIARRLAQKRREMIIDLEAQIQTMRSADCIKDAFREAIRFVQNNPKIQHARYSWYCGVFWSSPQYDIILYDSEGYRKRIYNEQRLSP